MHHPHTVIRAGCCVPEHQNSSTSFCDTWSCLEETVASRDRTNAGCPIGSKIVREETSPSQIIASRSDFRAATVNAAAPVGTCADRFHQCVGPWCHWSSTLHISCAPCCSQIRARERHVVPERHHFPSTHNTVVFWQFREVRVGCTRFLLALTASIGMETSPTPQDRGSVERSFSSPNA